MSILNKKSVYFACFFSAISAMADVYINGVSVTSAITTESDPLALPIANSASNLAAGAVSAAGDSMTGILDMGGNSITNIGTNSLTFLDGTKVSVLSNGVLGVSTGGTNSPKTVVDSGNIDTYAPAAPTYYADGYTLQKDGTTFSVQSWIPENLIQLRYETWNHWATQERGLLDGPGYWFSDQNGILPELSSNVAWSTAGYDNYSMMAVGIISNTVDVNAPAVDLSGLSKSNSAFSFFAWHKTAEKNVAADGIMSVGGVSWLTGWKIWVSAIGDIAMDCGQTTNLWNAYTLPDSYYSDPNLHLLGFTYAGGAAGAVKVYYDGAVVWLTNLTVNVTGTTMDMINETYSTAALYGIQRGIYLWNRELSTTDVVTIYSLGHHYVATTNIAPWNDALAYGWPVVVSDISNVADIGPNNTPLGYDENYQLHTNSLSGDVSSYSCLVATNSLLTFIPAYAYASTLIYSTGTPAPSNLILAVSRDGTNWAQSMSVSVVDTWDVSNKLVAAYIAMTNQPVGSNVFAKIVITNGCPKITVKGIAAPCGQ